MITMRAAGLILCWGLQSATVFGGLLFSDRKVEIEAAPDAEKLVIEFPFEVKGEEAVTIANYDAPCSCLSAQISDGGRLTWKPGEKGVVKGIFELGSFKGTVEKYIILTLAGEDAIVKLTVVVTIPELVKIDPPTLSWEIGGEGGPKSFKITMHDKVPIKLLETTITNPQFEYELKTIREGAEYELVVTPKGVATRSLGMVRMRTDSAMTRHQRYQAFVMIRKEMAEVK